MMVRTAVVLSLMALTAVAGWLARDWLSASPAPSSAPDAETARVVRGRLEQNVKARGIVKPAPNALVRVGFPMPKDVARRIHKLHVAEGDEVKAGAVLAELDHDDLAANLDQLKADAGVAERRLEALRELEPVEVGVAEATRDQAQAQATYAGQVHDRLRTLVTGSAASREEMETAANDRAVAQAKLRQADAGLKQVKARFKTDIATAEASLKLARAAVKAAEVMVRWSTIRSPMDGVVFAAHQRQGELTSNNPAAPVVTLLDPGQLQVHLYVDEADFGRVRVGQAVSLRVDAHPGETLDGKIVRLLPQPILQENVVYYLAVAEVEEARRAYLRAEMTALAHVRVAGGESVLWLPLAAVKSRPDGWYVRKPTPAGPAESKVRIGGKGEGRVEIAAGLDEGDEVLLEP